MSVTYSNNWNGVNHTYVKPSDEASKEYAEDYLWHTYYKMKYPYGIAKAPHPALHYRDD